MLEYNVQPNQDVFIRWVSPFKATNLYPVASIRSIDDPTTEIASLELEHVGSGVYGLKWPAGAKGLYFTIVTIYTDGYGVGASEVDNTDSDSINVGFLTGGIGFTPDGDRETHRTELTKKEIKKIVDALKEVIMPELEKKSEFDPARDMVLTDLSSIESGVKALTAPISAIQGCVEATEVVVNNIKLEPTDLSPILLAMAESFEVVKEALAMLDGNIASRATRQDIITTLAEKVAQFESVADDMAKTLKDIGSREDNIPSLIAENLSKAIEDKKTETIATGQNFMESVNGFMSTMAMKEFREGVVSGDADDVYDQLKSAPKDMKRKLFDIIRKRNPQLLVKVAKLHQQNA